MRRLSFPLTALLLLACREAPPRPEPAPLPPVASAPLPPVAPAPLPKVAPVATIAPLSSGARTEDEQNTIAVFQAAIPAAVYVTRLRRVVDPFREKALDVPEGSGSGFLWDAKGHVVTNFHVIQNARRVTVTLHDHRTYNAQVIGTEPRRDIAVLKLEAPLPPLQPIVLAASGEPLVVGQKVLAIGNPFGLDETLTTGIISALGREVDGIGGVTIRDMVQTDAAINPGNSGGPLLDSRGRLIGMNTMIFSQSGASAGIGFAVPYTTIARLVPQIIAHGRAIQVGLGIQIDPQRRIESRWNIPGVAVLEVNPSGPAQEAGLMGLRRGPRGIELGDVVTAVDGKPVADYDDLYNTLDGYAPGDIVRVTILRKEQSLTVPVKLEQIN